MSRIRTTVVLVEDNPLHARRFRDNIALDPTLHLLAEFASAEAALESVAALRADVALVDIGLPGASGFEVIRHLRRRTPTPPSPPCAARRGAGGG